MYINSMKTAFDQITPSVIASLAATVIARAAVVLAMVPVRYVAVVKR